MNQPLPKRRSERLVVREVGHETLVYDLDADRVHNLPEQTARLWAACDGTQSVAGLRLLSGMSETEAIASLASLEELGLLEAGSTGGIARRTVLQAAAVGAGAMAIGSVAVPANAQGQLASICIDANPLDGESLCEVFSNFFTNPPNGLTFPATPGTCAAPDNAFVGSFDPRCPGFQVFYKETNSESLNAIGNLKSDFNLCRDLNGDRYVQFKQAGGQNFPVYDPVARPAPASCTCFGACGGVLMDLANTNSFIFGYTLPAGAVGTWYIRYSVCYPAATAQGGLPRISVATGSVSQQSGNFSGAFVVPFATINPVANGCSTDGCFAINPTNPMVLFWFKNPTSGGPPGPVWVDARVTQTPC